MKRLWVFAVAVLLILAVVGGRYGLGQHRSALQAQLSDDTAQLSQLSTMAAQSCPSIEALTPVVEAFSRHSHAYRRWDWLTSLPASAPWEQLRTVQDFAQQLAASLLQCRAREQLLTAQQALSALESSPEHIADFLSQIERSADIARWLALWAQPKSVAERDGAHGFWLAGIDVLDSDDFDHQVWGAFSQLPLAVPALGDEWVLDYQILISGWDASAVQWLQQYRLSYEQAWDEFQVSPTTEQLSDIVAWFAASSTAMVDVISDACTVDESPLDVCVELIDRGVTQWDARAVSLPVEPVTAERAVVAMVDGPTQQLLTNVHESLVTAPSPVVQNVDSLCNFDWAGDSAVTAKALAFLNDHQTTLQRLSADDSVLAPTVAEFSIEQLQQSLMVLLASAPPKREVRNVELMAQRLEDVERDMGRAAMNFASNSDAVQALVEQLQQQGSQRLALTLERCLVKTIDSALWRVEFLATRVDLYGVKQAPQSQADGAGVSLAYISDYLVAQRARSAVLLDYVRPYIAVAPRLDRGNSSSVFRDHWRFWRASLLDYESFSAQRSPDTDLAKLEQWSREGFDELNRAQCKALKAQLPNKQSDNYFSESLSRLHTNRCR